MGNDSVLTLPEKYKEKEYAIKEYAFYDCYRLTSITLPEGLTSIGDHAFDDCYRLTSITLPEGLTSIGDHAFDGCKSLTTITLPEGLTSIGEYAFDGCYGLTSITLPEGLTSIGDHAFLDCRGLTSITLPESLTSIGESVFSSCSRLTSIILPESLTSIGDYTFYRCSSLTSITLPEGLTSIGGYAFSSCSKLQKITCYALEPPTLGTGVFRSIGTNAVLQVPPGSIPLYAAAEGWKDLAIYYAQSLEVNLPAGSEDGRYRNMTLELVDTENGQKQRYVISDRVTYTFNGLQRGHSFNVYLRNSMGAVLGEIADVLIGEEDASVSFESVRQSQHIDMAIRTPEGEDVTEQAQIRWFDGEGNYLQQGSKLSGLLAGTSVRYSIRLPQTLGMQYALPADSLYTIREEGNALVCTLLPLEETTITGRVKDAATGSALSGAVVSVSQKLNGLYSKSFTAKTDSKGGFAATVYNAQSTVTVSAPDYLSQSLEFANFNDTAFVGEVALKSISGAVITTSLSYTESVAEGETAEIQDWYADHDNVAYEIYNETQGHAIMQFNVQYPSIVLLEEVAEGDSLRLTASSRTNAFAPVTATATVDAQNRAEAAFNIIGLGGIRASFVSTDNASVVGLLYDGKGQLVKKYGYSNASLSIADLTDGNYTLVTMTDSPLFNSIPNLPQFAASGLKEGTDYVKNTVTVISGKIASVANNMIPVLDESKLYYTGNNTGFSVNKTSLVAGNYLTLKGKIDFKDVYAAKVSKVSMVVDLPESCSFVENSVMVGSNIVGYTLDGSRLTIPLSGQSADQIRFCVIPTKTGDYTPCAFAQFALDGKEVLQPIGNANFTVKGLTLSVPGMVARTSVPVSGTVPQGNSTIELFDNGIKIGETTSLANGLWSTMCELHEPYNLSRHSIYVKVVNAQGLELQSEAQELVYDRNAIEVNTVTMINISHREGNYYEEKTVFDFQNPPKSIPAYWYWPSYPEFTFLIDFTDNDTTKVSDVVLYVETCKGNQVPLQATYNADKGLWVASGNFGNWSNYDIPTNVSLDYDCKSEIVIDRDALYDQSIDINTLNAINSEQTTMLESFLSQMSELDLDDNLRTDLWDSIFSTLDIDTINVTIPENQSDELFEFANNLLVEIDNFEKANSDMLWYGINNLASEFSINLSEFGSNGNVSVLKCDDLNVEMLIENGYEQYLLDDSSQIYLKTSETETDIVDLKMNQRILLSFPSSLKKLAQARAEESDFSRFWNAITLLRNTISIFANGCDDIQNKFNKYIADLEHQLLTSQKASKALWLNARKCPFDDKRISWQASSIRLDERCKNIARQISIAKKSSLVVARIASKALSIYAIVNDAVTLYNDLVNLSNLVSDVPSCPNYPEKSQDLINRINWLVSGKLATETGNILCDVAAINAAWASVVAAPATGGSSLTITPGIFAGTLVKVVINVAIDIAFRDIERNIRDDIARLSDDPSCTKCGEPNTPPCPEPNPEDGNRGGNGGANSGGNGGEHKSNNPQVEGVHDPSGYVYEGVSSNRLEGVMASCYYKETVEDMYGDKHERIVLWDAEQYAQENPLFTDENGMYRWDVPQGVWQVKYEKDGYETTYSDWLPVPPPQLEVNIAMTQNRQPEVEAVRAYEDGIEVDFDKYMQPDGLTAKNIFVTRNGETVAGTVKLLNEEQAYGDNPVSYASKVRFVPETPFLTTDEVVLTVNRNVKSYAGVPMESDYTQAFDIEKEVKSLAVDSIVRVAYNGEKEITVSALPYDAAIGKKLVVTNSSSMIATLSADTLTLDENGQAKLMVNGELPGTAMLTFTLAETDVKAPSVVQVVAQEFLTTAAPKASRASGTAVYRGTVVRLTCETKDAVIYYTLDGSCPCDENAPRMVYEYPIIITDDMTIKAMAAVAGQAESGVAEFNFTIKRTNLGMELKEGWNWVSHNMETEMSPAILPQNATHIVGKTAELVNDPVLGLVGNLITLHPSEAYKIQMPEDSIHVMSGYEFNPAKSISLKQGRNWLGYPVSQTMSLNEAFANAELNEGDYIVGQDGFAQYADGSWAGTLQTMVPGKGYMYHSMRDNSFIYNTALVSKAKSLYRTAGQNRTPWYADKHKYPNIMCLIAEVYDNGQVSEDYSIGAFCGTECRGVGKYVDGKLMMNIYGEGNEKIVFRAVHTGTQETFLLTEELSFKETLIGSLSHPYALHFDEDTGVEEIRSGWNVWVEGNDLYLALNGKPFDTVTLTDANGTVYLSKETVSENEPVNILELSAGVYIVTAVQGKDVYSKKILKK